MRYEAEIKTEKEKSHVQVVSCLAVVGAGPAGRAACVELTGQRILWSYDAVKDEIQILLYYDGIHDSGDDRNGKGLEQVPKFVQDGDFMLLDWPFHFNRVQLQAQAENQAAGPLERDWAKLGFRFAAKRSAATANLTDASAQSSGSRSPRPRILSAAAMA